MIVLKTSNFVLFILLIIFGTIAIYIQIFPCECKLSKNCRKINIIRGKVKYVPIYLDSKGKKADPKKLENKMDLNKCNKKENIKPNIKNKENKLSSASIGNHSSTHGGSIVPSVWIDDDDSEKDFEFKY